MSARTRLPNDGSTMLTKSQEAGWIRNRGGRGSGHSPTVASNNLSLGSLDAIISSRKLFDGPLGCVCLVFRYITVARV